MGETASRVSRTTVQVLVSAVITLVISFGVKLTPEQASAITSILVVIVTLVMNMVETKTDTRLFAAKK